MYDSNQSPSGVNPLEFGTNIAEYRDDCQTISLLYGFRDWQISSHVHEVDLHGVPECNQE